MKVKLISVLVSTVWLAQSSFAANYVAVDKLGCAKRVNHFEPFVLLLKSGDSLHEGIQECAKNAQLIGASIQGLGQLVNPTFAYYGSDPKDLPKFTEFKGMYEMISLNGNLSLNKNASDNQYYTHIHAVLGDHNFSGLAGHIKEAKIGVTAELTITPFASPLLRAVDAKTGFGPIITD